jgi:hypothetical protein
VGDVDQNSEEATVTTLTMDPRPTAHTRTTPPSSPSPLSAKAHTARDRLSPLLARAAALDLDDAEGWAHLRAVAHATTAVLTAADLLPPQLRVRHGDTPNVIARTLATAWRWVGAT